MSENVVDLLRMSRTHCRGVIMMPSALCSSLDLREGDFVSLRRDDTSEVGSVRQSLHLDRI